MYMKIISWNVNGIRAILKKNFMDFIKEEKPDIICIQETKAHPEQVDHGLEGYHQFWDSAEKKGYSGTAVFTKIKPSNINYGLSLPDHDKEGRVVTAEFDKFYLVNVYTPNAQPELKRISYRTKWDKAFLDYCKKLDKKKPVIFCGDLNVAHKEIDLKNPKSNKNNPGFSPKERAGFDNIVKANFVDAFREFNQEPDQYTWWSYRFNARAKGIGWRIDYFCVSKRFMKNVKKCEILDHVMGSDHCPVKLTLKK